MATESEAPDPIALLPIAREIAGSMARNIPRPFDVEDAFSAGELGVLEACSTFDPTRKVPLNAWVAITVRHRIKDWLREIDHLGRAQRERVRGTLWEPKTVSLDARGPCARSDPWLENTDGIQLGDPRSTDFVASVLVDDLLRCLTIRETRIIRAYYWDGLEMDEIGNDEHVSQSRVSQLLKRARMKMRLRVKCKASS